jgi:hypothetical protein
MGAQLPLHVRKCQNRDLSGTYEKSSWYRIYYNHTEKEAKLKSPKFREWLAVDEDAQGRVDALIDNSGHILFFKKDDNIFGATEDSRVIFAKMKNPDDETPDGWADEASFSADNLNKKIRGEPGQHVFCKEDLKKMEIIDREEAVKSLKKEAEKAGDKMPDTRFRVFNLSQLFQKDPDDAPNFVRADEK